MELKPVLDLDNGELFVRYTDYLYKQLSKLRKRDIIFLVLYILLAVLGITGIFTYKPNSTSTHIIYVISLFGLIATEIFRQEHNRKEDTIIEKLSETSPADIEMLKTLRHEYDWADFAYIVESSDSVECALVPGGISLKFTTDSKSSVRMFTTHIFSEDSCRNTVLVTTGCLTVK